MVAVDERKKRTGKYIEMLGTYNPLTEPKQINLKKDRIEAWIKNGAQLSVGYLRIIGQAKQRPPRKPKQGNQPTSQSVTVPKPETEATKEVQPEPVETSQPENIPSTEHATEAENPEEKTEETS